MATTLFLSAGDPSGDIASSRLIITLRNLVPGLTVFGLGGEKLKALGQQQLAEGRDLAVLGFWEVARRFFLFRRLMDRCVEEIRRRQPAAIVLVDYPGFNLRLARRVKALGIPIIYYISPQVWAWGQKRVEEIRQLIDLMLVILPFEELYYQQLHMPVKFVGHYLLDDIPAEFIQSALPDTEPPLLGLLPGSRKQEIERMLPPMLATAVYMFKVHGLRSSVAAVAERFDYECAVGEFGAKDFVSITYDDSRQVVYKSSLVVCASGTATLECGIIGRPMVVVYRTGFITYHIARRLITLDRIALVNLVLGEEVVPELIQHQVTPARIQSELDRYRTDADYCHQVKSLLDTIPDRLGGSGASERAARLIAERIQQVNTK